MDAPYYSTTKFWLFLLDHIYVDGVYSSHSNQVSNGFMLFAYGIRLYET